MWQELESLTEGILWALGHARVRDSLAIATNCRWTKQKSINN